MHCTLTHSSEDWSQDWSHIEIDSSLLILFRVLGGKSSSSSSFLCSDQRLQTTCIHRFSFESHVKAGSPRSGAPNRLDPFITWVLETIVGIVGDTRPFWFGIGEEALDDNGEIRFDRESYVGTWWCGHNAQRNLSVSSPFSQTSQSQFFSVIFSQFILLAHSGCTCVRALVFECSCSSDFIAIWVSWYSSVFDDEVSVEVSDMIDSVEVSDMIDSVESEWHDW